MDVDGDGHTDVLLVAAPMYYAQGWERGKVYVYAVTPEVRCFCRVGVSCRYDPRLPSVQTSLVLQGALEVSDGSQNSRLGSSLAEIQDMNGDGFRELVVGAPLEDGHQGAVYVFYGQGRNVQRQFRQVRGAELEPLREKSPQNSPYLLSSAATGCCCFFCRSEVFRPECPRCFGCQRRRAG